MGDLIGPRRMFAIGLGLSVVVLVIAAASCVFIVRRKRSNEGRATVVAAAD